MIDGDGVSATFRESLCASRIAGLGLSAGFQKESNQNSGAKHALCDREWTPVFFHESRCQFRADTVLSSWAGIHSPLTRSLLESFSHSTTPFRVFVHQGTVFACHISSKTSVNGSRGIRARQNNFQISQDTILGHLACRPIPTLSSDDGNGFDGQEHDPVPQSIQRIIGAVLKSRVFVEHLWMIFQMFIVTSTIPW